MTVLARKSSRILIVDDDPDFRALLRTFLKKYRGKAEVVEYDPDALGVPGDDFNWADFDLMLLDYDLGRGGNGLDWLSRFGKVDNFPATIVLTAAGNESIAVRALKGGAFDYLAKQKLKGRVLAEAMDGALERTARERSVEQTNTIIGERFNKRLFYARLQQAIEAANPDSSVALLMVEVDDFERLRGNLGLLAIDQLIKRVAKVVHAYFSERKWRINLTRYGDLSLALLVQQLEEKQDLERVAGALCEALGEVDFRAEAGGAITFSTGVVPIVNDEMEPLEVFMSADQACRDARAEPGNTFLIRGAVPGAPDAAKEPEEPSRDITAMVKQAFEEHRVTSIYQPMLLINQTLEWLPDELYDVRPRVVLQDGNFLAYDLLVEELSDSLMQRMLDRWMFRRTLSEVRQLAHSEQRNIGLLMRASSSSLTDMTLVSWLKQLVQRHNPAARADKVIIELSANSFMADTKKVVAFIDFMRASLGYRFSLYGADSLATLNVCAKRGRFDFVRLPASVLDQGVESDPLRGLVDAAHSFGSLVAAESIEDADTLTGLVNLGVDLVQGEFVGPVQEDLLAELH